VAPLVGGGQAKRGAGALDALLGAADPLGHGGLGDQECAGDLDGGEAADGAQGQGDRRGGGEHGVATHEEEDEGVIVLGELVVRGRCERLGVAEGGLFSPPARGLAARSIGEAPRGDVDQPGARVVGEALARPLHGRGEQGLLDGVLGGREVPVAPNDGAEDLRCQLAEELRDAVVDRSRHARWISCRVRGVGRS
jgi:hypothetical protein